MIRSVCMEIALLGLVDAQHRHGVLYLHVAVKSTGLDARKPLALKPLGEHNFHDYVRILNKSPWVPENDEQRLDWRHALALAQVKAKLESPGHRIAKVSEVHPVYVVNN